MSKRRRLRERTCLEDLTPHDRAEVEKFKQFLTVELSRKAGVDPWACDMLEAAIYPEGIGRVPTDENHDA